MKRVEDTYKLTTIKMANYLNNSDDKRMKDIDRRTRESLRKEGGMHHHESIKVLYLPEELGGKWYEKSGRHLQVDNNQNG